MVYYLYLFVLVPECELPCQNGAPCVNGVCHCLAGFTDRYCNVKGKEIFVETKIMFCEIVLIIS